MLTNTKIALAAAVILGTASVSLANDVETNPSSAQSAREWREFLGQHQKHMGNVGTSYGHSATPQEDDSRSGKKSRNH